VAMVNRPLPNITNLLFTRETRKRITQRPKMPNKPHRFTRRRRLESEISRVIDDTGTKREVIFRLECSRDAAAFEFCANINDPKK
jgi:hypothetical protein